MVVFPLVPVLRAALPAACLSTRGVGLCLAVMAGLVGDAPAAGAAAPAGGAPSDTLGRPPVVIHSVSDTLFVYGVREPGSAGLDGPALVTVVPLEEARGGADLAGLLASSAGLHVRRYGGLGAESVPTIRGASGAQVALLVDGVPLTDAQDGRVDLSSLPLERFATAEVYRGPAPPGCGGEGSAAAINLTSRAPGESGASARLFAGSGGDRGGRLMQGWRAADGRCAALLLLHGRHAENDFVFQDHNQTFANAADDRERVRANADFAEWGSALLGRWDGARLRAAISVGTFRRDGGRPGPLGYESPHARVRHERRDAHLSLEDPRLGWRLDVAGARAIEWLYDDAREVGWDPPGTTRGESRDVSGRWAVTRATALSGGRLALTAGGDWRGQWFDERRPGATDPRRARRTITAFASLRGDVYGPRVSLAPSWRWQRLTDNFPPLPALPWLPETPLAAAHVQDAVTPAVAAIWEARPARLFVEAHVSRTLRAPTWVELFGHRGGVDGNRALRPERVAAHDVAVRWGAPDGSRWTRLALFTTVTDRAIVFVQNSQRTSQARNIGLTRADGLEWEAGGGAAGGTRWSANVTWQDVRDRGVDPVYRGKRVPFLPAVETALSGTMPLGAWEAGAELTHESSSWRDRYNSAVERAPARTLLSLSLARTWGRAPGRTLAATAELVNVTNNSVYDVEGFPLPGRAFRLSLLAR